MFVTTTLEPAARRVSAFWKALATAYDTDAVAPIPGRRSDSRVAGSDVWAD